jgi:serine/threonine-protein kinase
MSDFLKQFSDKNYKENEGPQAQGDAVSDTNTKQSGVVQSAQEPAAAQNSKQKITSAAHEVKKDEGYDRKKIAKYLAIAASVLAVAALALGVFFITNQVQVRDFVGMQALEARTWGIQNRVTIEVREVYSLEYESDIVVSQNRDPKSRISRRSVLILEVSRGPNMTEHIKLPDFSNLTTQEVRQWREEVRALNASITEEYSTDVEAGQHIRYEFTDTSTTRDNYTRADGLLIYMSRGAQVFEANILVPDFFDQSLEEAQSWAREHGVGLTLNERAHADIVAGHVSKQSIEPGERVARGDEIELTVSLGTSIVVPNFANISSERAIYPGLEVTVERRYSTSLAFGRLISQSVPAGTELIGESHNITVIYSLGRPYIDNLIGESEARIAEYFYSFASQGANITYRIDYVSSHEPRGTIVGMSQFAQFLSLNEHIRIQVSRGDLDLPVDASGEGE